MLNLSVTKDAWPINGAFTISRGTKTQAETVTVRISDGQFEGCGECVPYQRYGETLDGVVETIQSCAGDLKSGMTRHHLQHRLPAGAARNALDCALWDLEAKQTGTPVWQLAGLARPRPLTTAYTLSLDTPDIMAIAAQTARARPVLKLKLAGDDDDLARIRAVVQAAPRARLILDANEAWTFSTLQTMASALQDLHVDLIEQPLSAGKDEALETFSSPIPLCADESIHDMHSLTPLIRRYNAINIKLDKTGGLTEAILLAKAAHRQGLQIMVGCMVSTSLAMAPAFLLGAQADFIDLDGPLLLTTDRAHGMHYKGSILQPPEQALWG